MSAARKLRVVASTTEPKPSFDYEWQERQRIARKDWARVHIDADRRGPLFFADRPKRLWLR